MRIGAARRRHAAAQSRLHADPATTATGSTSTSISATTTPGHPSSSDARHASWVSSTLPMTCSTAAAMSLLSPSTTATAATATAASAITPAAAYPIGSTEMNPISNSSSSGTAARYDVDATVSFQLEAFAPSSLPSLMKHPYPDCPAELTLPRGGDGWPASWKGSAGAALGGDFAEDWEEEEGGDEWCRPLHSHRGMSLLHTHGAAAAAAAAAGAQGGSCQTRGGGGAEYEEEENVRARAETSAHDGTPGADVGMHKNHDRSMTSSRDDVQDSHSHARIRDGSRALSRRAAVHHSGINSSQTSAALTRMRTRPTGFTQAILFMYLNIGSDPPDFARVEPCAKLECWLDPLVAHIQYYRHKQRLFEPAPRLYTRPPEDGGGAAADTSTGQHRRGGGGAAAAAAALVPYPTHAQTHTHTHMNQPPAPPCDPARRSGSDVIAEALERQYRRVLRERVGFMRIVELHIDGARAALIKARQLKKEGRVLVHYNGHGMPRATTLGEVWMLNKEKTHYVPLNVVEAAERVGYPVLFVLDCNGAGAVLQRWFAERRHEKRPDDFFLCACSADETLPIHPQLPADVLTSCLTTPLTMALEWYIAYSHRRVLLPRVTAEMIRALPATNTAKSSSLPRLRRGSMRAELQRVLDAVMDCIAWCTMSPAHYGALLRRHDTLRTLFTNAFLADKLLREAGCTPVSYPPVSESAHLHPMWDVWEYTLERAVSVLPRWAAAAASSSSSATSPTTLASCASATSWGESTRVGGAGGGGCGGSGSVTSVTPELAAADWGEDLCLPLFVPQTRRPVAGRAAEETGLAMKERYAESAGAGGTGQRWGRACRTLPTAANAQSAAGHSSIWMNPIHSNSNSIHTNNSTQHHPPSLPHRMTTSSSEDVARAQERWARGITRTFFADQLTAFEVWLHAGDLAQTPPPLPCVLRALRESCHRVRALTLLTRYLDAGQAVAGRRAIRCGMLPYLSKLMTTTPHVFLLVTVLWMQAIRAGAADACAAEMRAHACEKHMISLLKMDEASTHVVTVRHRRADGDSINLNNHTSRVNSVKRAEETPAAATTPSSAMDYWGGRRRGHGGVRWWSSPSASTTNPTAPANATNSSAVSAHTAAAADMAMMSHCGPVPSFFTRDTYAEVAERVAACDEPSSASEETTEHMSRSTSATSSDDDDDDDAQAEPSRGAAGAHSACVPRQPTRPRRRGGRTRGGAAVSVPIMVASHAVLPGDTCYHLMPNVTLPRCKSMACYILAQFMMRGGRAHCLLCWNNSLLNAAYPCLRSDSAELRSWGCLVLSTLFAGLRHAAHFAARECVTRGDAFTALLADASPVVRSSAVTLLATMTGLRLDELAAAQQLRRLESERSLLIRLRELLYDASMHVREELVFFAVRLLHAYGEVVSLSADGCVSAATDAAQHATCDNPHANHTPEDDTNSNHTQDNTNNIRTNMDTSNNSDDETMPRSFRMRDYVWSVWREQASLADSHRPGEAIRPRWQLEELRVDIKSRLHTGRPTMNTRFHDSVTFDTAFLTHDDPPPRTTRVRWPAIAPAARAVMRGLVHDAAVMLHVLHHHCEARAVAAALRTCAGIVTHETDNSNNNNNSSSTSSTNNNNNMKEEENDAGDDTIFNSHNSAPHSLRFSLEALRTMSTVVSTDSPGSSAVSEADRARATWNADSMRQLVLDRYDARRVAVEGVALRGRRVGGVAADKEPSVPGTDAEAEEDDEEELCRTQILPSQVAAASVVCASFRALEPAMMLVTRDQTFTYVCYDDFARQRTRHSFTLGIGEAVRELCIVNDLATDAGLLVANMRGGFHLVTGVWGEPGERPRVAAMFSACRPRSNYTSSDTTSVGSSRTLACDASCLMHRGAHELRHASLPGQGSGSSRLGLNPARTTAHAPRVDVSCAYRNSTATLFYGGAINPDDGGTEIHALSLREEQVIQRLPVPDARIRLTCLSVHASQRALFAGFADGVVRYYDDRLRQGPLGAVGWMSCMASPGHMSNTSSAAAAAASQSAAAAVSSPVVLGVGACATGMSEMGYSVAAATAEGLCIFDVRRLSDPVSRFGVAQLYHGSYSAAALRTPPTPRITNCVVSVFTGLIGLSFSDGSYGAFNDKGQLLHDSVLRVGEVRRGAMVLPCSVAVHPLRSMMTFGGEILSLQP